MPTAGQPAVATTAAYDRSPTGSRAPAQQQAPAPVSGTGSADAAESRVSPARDVSLPAHSGTGKRVVFSQSRQRVWLVTGGHRVARTYLVSGSVYDNLDPGTFEVYSRSEQAYGIDDSGTMKYFVRFTQGDSAAIGFHDIPIDDGHLVQTVAQLGTPQSHGCIRQERPDAIALWKFAPLGTTVVVTA
nr:L,D-transpeptidase [Nocardioides luti]